MDVLQDLGVQSYCFRGFKGNEKVAELVKECGLSKIELCAVHTDFTDDSVIDVYRNNGVDVVSIGVETFKGDEERETQLFEFAQKAGAKVIAADFAIDSVPAAFRTAEKLADQYDINLAIHNHGGRHWLGAAATLAQVFAKTNERIGLCLDTAWALDSGEDPIAMAETFASRLYGIHIKDFVFDQARKPEDVVCGQGNLDLDSLLQVMRNANFTGPTILEYEGDVDNPVPALKECVAAVEVAAA
ncbi:MAG TPA: sugar phosphate isomerase/epimerase [Candidatus Hydrogenedentes bacterium]|nr:sugar phosphate isomerase/epimerase [Candidatus Hydrogenedentota bacterium]